MTTEEKARAYDEAIKVAKGLFNSPRTCFDIDQLTNIFPQLAESEDERIRKHIVKFIDEQYPTHGNLKEEKDKMLAYLEKQKEHTPNLVPKIIRPKFAVGDTVCRNMWSDHTIREIYIDCDDPTYICINEEGLESHISFSEQDEWERKEPKPVEWDDYTEMNLDRAIQIIKNAKGNLQGYQSDDGIYECDKAIECLEHFLYRGLEMERLAEWSKEDDKIRKALIAFLEMNTGYFACDGFTKDDIIQWLKSFRPQPKQEWSEEDENQAIEGIIPILKDVAYQGSFGNPNQETMLGFARRILKSLRPQPKQEWGEEDEEMFFFINELLENKGRDYFTTLVYDAVQNWLKNRFKSLRPQPKKELSIEKAIQWLDDTFYFLDNSSGRGRDCEITTHDFDSLEEMYDSFRKAVTVDSEPHWKPSEEQMGVLKKALYINPASGKLHELKENEVCILQGLLKQLEKL